MTSVALQTDPTVGYLRSAATDYSSQAFLGDNGSLIKQQNMAFQVPLGSQLDLLQAQQKGNKYLDFAARHNVKLSDSERATFMNMGYNELQKAPTGAGYFSFSSAYGK